MRLVYMFLCIVLIIFGPQVTRRGMLERDRDLFLDAICTVESSNFNQVIGDNGKAIGPYQIHKDYWTDAIRAGKLGGQYTDCFNEEYARNIVRVYLQHYAPRAWELRDYTVLASVHHKGPSGLKDIDLEYWNKIRGVMYGKHSNS